MKCVFVGFSTSRTTKIKSQYFNPSCSFFIGWELVLAGDTVEDIAGEKEH
jgi:hypothetical protein